MSDNTPTLRLPTTPPAASPSVPPPAPPERPSRGPLVAFILLSIVVVVAAGVLIYVLIGRGGAINASASVQASNSAVATETAAPPAPAKSPPGEFTAFTAPSSLQCRGHGKDRQEVDAQVSWTTANATQVWVAEGTTDAQQVGSEQVPLSGDQDSFPNPLPIDCNGRSTTFTMTLVGADGTHVSRTWSVMVVGRHD